ncbi:MAG: hypothetical protein ACLUNZ_12925, partial [Evtepia sp.]
AMALLAPKQKDLPHGLPGHRAALPPGQRQRGRSCALHRCLPHHHQELGEKGRARPGGERGFPTRHAGDGEITPLSTLNDQQQAAYQGLLDLMEEPAPGGAAVRHHRQRQDPGLSPPDPEGPGGWTAGPSSWSQRSP